MRSFLVMSYLLLQWFIIQLVRYDFGFTFFASGNLRRWFLARFNGWVIILFFFVSLSPKFFLLSHILKLCSFFLSLYCILDIKFISSSAFVIGFFSIEKMLDLGRQFPPKKKLFSFQFSLTTHINTVFKYLMSCIVYFFSLIFLYWFWMNWT